VPLIIGNVREEPDLAPQRLVNNMTFLEFTTYIRNHFSTFSPTLGQQVLNLYPPALFSSFQQVYDQISADIGTICGNIELASQAASYFKSPVYHYVATAAPTTPACAVNTNNGEYCPTYSFHTYDLVTMCDDFTSWNFTQQELAFGNLVLQRFVELTTNGNISALTWAPFNSVNGYQTTLFDVPELLVVNYKTEECAFWKKKKITSTLTGGRIRLKIANYLFKCNMVVFVSITLHEIQ